MENKKVEVKEDCKAPDPPIVKHAEVLVCVQRLE
jgi:hypothetical protein